MQLKTGYFISFEQAASQLPHTQTLRTAPSIFVHSQPVTDKQPTKPIASINLRIAFILLLHLLLQAKITSDQSQPHKYLWPQSVQASAAIRRSFITFCFIWPPECVCVCFGKFVREIPLSVLFTYQVKFPPPNAIPAC